MGSGLVSYWLFSFLSLSRLPEIFRLDMSVRVVFYFPLAPDVSLASRRPRGYNLKCYRAFRRSLYFVICFLRHDFCPFFLSDSNTQDFSVSLHFSMYGFPFFSDSDTQDFSVFLTFSLYGLLFRTRHTGLECALLFYLVDVEFFVGRDIIKLLLTFDQCPCAYDLAFRTHRHMPSTAVASVPPFFFFGFLLAFPCWLVPRTVAFLAFRVHHCRPPLRLSRLVVSVQWHAISAFRLCFCLLLSFFRASIFPPSLPIKQGLTSFPRRLSLIHQVWVGL